MCNLVLVQMVYSVLASTASYNIRARTVGSGPNTADHSLRKRRKQGRPRPVEPAAGIGRSSGSFGKHFVAFSFSPRVPAASAKIETKAASSFAPARKCYRRGTRRAYLSEPCSAPRGGLLPGGGDVRWPHSLLADGDGRRGRGTAGQRRGRT
jgi:hypothetical protein